MDMQKLRNKYAIVGVGYTEQGKIPGRSATSFHLEASVNALKDAGLNKEDIDGYFMYRHMDPLGKDTDFTAYHVAEQLGIRPNFISSEHTCMRTWLTSAIGLLETGICKYVLVSYGDNAFTGNRNFILEIDSNTGSPVNELAAFGDFTALSKYATVARRAMFEEGTGPHVWKEIAVNQRKWAQLNPRALWYNKPMTYDDYLNAPMLVDPFRPWDAVGNIDGGRAVIITSTERAKDLKNNVVTIRGYGSSNVPDQPFLLKNNDEKSAAGVAAAQAFRMAGIGHSEVDACQIYDCFTFTVEHQLRDAGFFKRGESAEFFTPERIGPGGDLPINTSGGMLSEAYFMGMTLVSEAVMQLRGACGERQLGILPGTKTPNIIYCADNGAYLNSNVTMILERG